MSVDKLRNISLDLCNGCGACINACSLNAIEFVSNQEGFFYPLVANSCVECGLCERACPQLNSANALDWNKASRGSLAVGTDSQFISLSASGGAFATFARYVIEEKNGVVFGACMDSDFFVRHKHAESLDTLYPMLGSKYVQSDIGYSFRDCKQYLEEGRTVLFSGTPCQIAGLYGFLGKHYENLITVDIVCHGVSAPKAFYQYIDWISKKTHKKVISYRFRNRTKYARAGHIPRIVLRNTAGKDKTVLRSAKRDVFYSAYLDNKLFRTSCYSCPYAQEKRVSDLTIGDCNSYSRYKHFHPYEASSIVLENSAAGKLFWEAIAEYFDAVPLDVSAEMKSNKQLNRPSIKPECRDKVCSDFALGGLKYMKRSLSGI